MSNDEFASILRRAHPPTQVDKKARKEAQAFERGDYDHLSRKHGQQMRTGLHIIAMVTMFLVWFGFIALALTWFVHLLTPWSWLDETQSAQIQHLLFGAFAAGVVKILQRHITNHQD